MRQHRRFSLFGGLAGTASASVAATVAVAALAALTGCGGNTDAAASEPDASQDADVPTGNINAEFRLPSGSASTATYTLTGPNGFSQAGTLDFQGSQAIGFLIESVPSGMYTISFTATDGDGGMESCMGSTTVTVAAPQTAMVDLTGTCSGGPYVPIGFGTIETFLSLPTGISLASAACILAGPAGLEAQEALTVAGSSGLHFLLDHVPAGDGQVLSITGMATNGDVCSVSKSVDVAIGQTAQATIHLLCEAPRAGGGD
jgi:hypothetical protein